RCARWTVPSGPRRYRQTVLDPARVLKECRGDHRGNYGGGSARVTCPASVRRGVQAMGSEPEQRDAASTTARFGAITEGEEIARVEVPRRARAATGGLPPGRALLTAQRGPPAGARFLLATERTLAGRHPTADISLADVTVSRRHAEF